MTSNAAPKRVEVGSGPETIRKLRAALIDGVVPNMYVAGGDLVHTEQVSGDIAEVAADEDALLPIAASPLAPPVLASLLAEQAYVFRTKYRKTETGQLEAYEEECTPPQPAMTAALARKTWPGVPPLRGIIGAPVLRRDGTLLQQPGYDPATGLYLASRVALPPVPEQPTAEQVAEARDFLLGRFLRDFPWSTPADRANYIALLATPILRHFTRSLTPFALIDATMPASGKTILTAGPGMLYGQKVLPWPVDSEEEIRKQITAVLTEQVGVVIWDNLPEGTVIDSAILALLVTGGVWSDRPLGTSRSASTVNDRLWMATGNNLQVGGDMASRTVRVHLDPNMPRPEERDQSKFGIPNLDQWITERANQMIVMRHLLILVLDWTRAKAPRATGVAMRQFTPWAQALGGLLAHHGIDGFLTNMAAVRGIDEDESRWGAFLACWHDRHGSKWMTAAELRADGEHDGFGADPWDGQFITTHTGRPPNPFQLGKLLTGQAGRWRGDHVLRAGKHERGNRNVFRVESLADQSTTEIG
ncbi:hypothetical protein QLQ12_24985 [Actinoplanes sp. NEAU-A12]|uniref:DNA primase/polymerase bifunctional N-terminal domain-containing protein n=1 Tax=Actinoplanes sandaracinus TaxID=3045177 RepID=A0ABT6WQ90_9ACTN|nr:hypothetical protein [Actinoplanes sandaracinus]MDI6101878.1 hypothetical protein [Actinoplanes sandaracinus]